MLEIIAAVLFSLITGSLLLFQLALILGMPYGEYAWGGQHKVLPRNFRIASISSILIYVVFELVFLSKVGLLDVFNNTDWVSTLFILMTGYFLLGILMNGISRSKKERNLMMPLCVVLFLQCLIVIVF